MEWIKIQAGNHRYISEFLDDFAPGVWNKKLADTGGSHLLLTNSVKYVLVVPNVDLVKSMVKDGTVYPVLGVYGGVYKQQYINHLKAYGEVKKIVTTWDSLYKVIEWINPSEFQLCVDEYHLVLESIGFRYSAINRMFELINQFKNVRYISATPNQEEFEFSFLKELPHYEIVWGNVAKVHPIMHKSNNVVISVCSFIEKCIKGELEFPDTNNVITKVQELYIFLNSVKTIEQICRTLQLEQNLVKICCSNKKRNQLLLDAYTIEDVTAPNKKINFFTSKCFQGCNLYTNNGLIILVADTKNPSMLIDMSTQGTQIAGRIRKTATSLNCFRDKLVYIYSTNNKVTKEALEERFNTILTQNEDIMRQYSSLSLGAQNWIKSHIDEENDFLILDGDSVYISEDKKNYAKYQNYLRLTYKDDFSVINAFNKDCFSETASKTWMKWSAETAKKLSKVKMITYKTVVEDYYESKDAAWLTEYPELENYVKYLTLKECNSLHFVKAKLIKRASDIKASWEIIRTSFVKNTFYASSEIKHTLEQAFKVNNIGIVPKAKLIMDCPYIDCTLTTSIVDGKRVNGYRINNITKYFI